MNTHMVNCARCKTEFDPMFPMFDDPDQILRQAYGCAAFVAVHTAECEQSKRVDCLPGENSFNILFGCFGSTKIDMEIWKFVPNMPDNGFDYRPGQNICDECIQQHIDNKTLVFFRSTYA